MQKEPLAHFERNLICEIGRLNIPGRPILYATTEQCMDYFGLESIKILPLKKRDELLTIFCRKLREKV